MEQIFEYGNLFALSGWAALLVALFLPPARKAALIWAGLLVPALFGVAYVALLASAKDAHGGFNSIAQVRSLFQSDGALTAGWFHYLAFDLFVGTWIVREGVERIASPVIRIVLIPVLGLTFMFGPAGFLLFTLLRLLFRRPPAAAAQAA
jgi:hypothetical protein